MGLSRDRERERSELGCAARAGGRRNRSRGRGRLPRGARRLERDGDRSRAVRARASARWGNPAQVGSGAERGRGVRRESLGRAGDGAVVARRLPRPDVRRRGDHFVRRFPDPGSLGSGSRFALAGGTVAFSQIQTGAGALYRCPAAGPVSVLRSGNGTFFNTGSVHVNDADRVVVQMEYGGSGRLQRALLAVRHPEQEHSPTSTPPSRKWASACNHASR